MYSVSKRPILTLTVVAAATVEACRAISQSGGYPATGTHMHGVSDTNSFDGDELNIDVLGTSILECGAAVAVDELVQVGSDGKFIPKAAGKAVARAMSATTTSGQKFEALLLPANS